MSQFQTKEVVEQTCRTAEEFIKHYYESIDKRRHLLQKMYMDTGVLVWNGNGTSGRDAIGKFILDLPVSEHKVTSLDAQQILDTVTPNKLAYLISVLGDVKYQGKLPRNFFQTFMITNHEDKWKIVSDNFRFQVPVPS